MNANKQMSFDFEAGPRRATPETKRRLAGQCAKILYRLRQGPATNIELAAIGLKYNARISELRKAGFNVVCFKQDKTTGVCWYSLSESGRCDESTDG